MHFAVRLTEVVAVVSAAVVRRARVRVQVGPDAARLATHVRHPDVRDGVVGEELGEERFPGESKAHASFEVSGKYESTVRYAYRLGDQADSDSSC